MKIPFCAKRPVAVLIAGVLASAMVAPAVAVGSGGDIVKCVGQDGRVTLTDGECAAGDGLALVVGARKEKAGGAAGAGGEMEASQSKGSGVLAAGADGGGEAIDASSEKGKAANRGGAKMTRVEMGQMSAHDVWGSSRPARKMFDADIATVRAARNSLMALDEAAASARQQRAGSSDRASAE